eukprot:TRINITY_DN30553_c0_g1_i1.p1 TRINITY_DN30553_c0_g1~~TRINITY_DN30553_c0_g1_i1.p1  ORF type:complete len:414 (+),score=113.74 TRINITY_DN30553_c0_g1_i1:47-1288(+)
MPVPESDGAQPVRWLIVTAAVCCMLVSVCFSYSWAAFKLDLKGAMGWNEPTAAFVFVFATVGQNMVVHLGLLSDSVGLGATAAVAAALKAAGLGGMWWAVTSGVSNPVFFGLCLFADTQGMGAAILAGQKAVQKISPKRLSGLSASLCATAVGCGGVFATSMYDGHFRPDVAPHLAFSGVVGVSSVLAASLVMSTVGQTDGGASTKAAGQASVWAAVQTRSFAFVLLGMVVSWGMSMLWTGNMASFLTAVRYPDAAEARRRFFWTKTLAGIFVGPLCDAIPGLLAWVYLLTSCLMCGSAWLMRAGGDAGVAAVLAGAAFGLSATLCPLLVKQSCPSLLSTLYSIAKVGGLVSGAVWSWHASVTSTANSSPGDANCVGEACYAELWTGVLWTTVPLVALMLLLQLTAKPHLKTD